MTKEIIVTGEKQTRIPDGVEFLNECTIESGTISNIEEVKSRGAYVVAVVNSRCTELANVCDYSITIDAVESMVNSLSAIIPLQLISYYTGKGKNVDVDKPKNLAKSV